VARRFLPWVLIPLLAVLILVPVGFMFLGAFMSGALADPEARLTLEKVAAVYATHASICATLASTLAIALLVAGISPPAGRRIHGLAGPAAPTCRRGR